MVFMSSLHSKDAAFGGFSCDEAIRLIHRVYVSSGIHELASLGLNKSGWFVSYK